MGVFPKPCGELFQIHGSKFKLHPVSNLGQACVSGISHSMLLLGIGKDTLNSFLTGLVHRPADRCAAGLLCHFHIVTPDVPGNSLNAVVVLCTKMSGRTVAADLWITFILTVTVTVCRSVFQYLVFRTQNTIIILVIYILPPFMSVFHRPGTRIGCRQYLSIAEYQFADVRCLVGPAAATPLFSERSIYRRFAV